MSVEKELGGQLGDQRALDRAVGFVLCELLASALAEHRDVSVLADLRRLMFGASEDLSTSLAHFGFDSLAWMSIVTALEEKLGVEFSDEAVSDARAYTSIGLAKVVMIHATKERSKGEAE